MPKKFKAPAPAVLTPKDRKALYKKPVTAAQLLGLLEDGHQHEFFILLNRGFRSSKTIYKMGENKRGIIYDVYNGIDDSWQQLTAAQIIDPKSSKTYIGEAITKNALIYWGKQHGQK